MTYTMRKWDMLRACHAKLLEMVGREKLINIMDAIEKSGMYLALAYADYKCQSCGRGDSLTLQHLIKNNNKRFMDMTRFMRVRHNWENIIIFCPDCHIKEDGLRQSEDTFQTLSLENINKIKAYFNSGSTNAHIPNVVTEDVIKDLNLSIVEQPPSKRKRKRFRVNIY